MYYFDASRNEKYFEKQPQPHFQIGPEKPTILFAGLLKHAF